MGLYGANLLDLIILSALLLSGFFALARGFTRELVSLASWATAAVCVFRFAPTVSLQLVSYLREEWNYHAPPWFAATLSSIGIFIGVLFVFSFLNVYLARGMEKMGLGFADHAMGFLFGVLRGFALCAFLYFLFQIFVPLGGQMEVVATSRLRPALEKTIALSAPVIENAMKETLTQIFSHSPEEMRDGKISP